MQIIKGKKAGARKGSKSDKEAVRKCQEMVEKRLANPGQAA